MPAGADGVPAGLEGLAAAVAALAAEDLDQLGEALAAEQVEAMRRLLDQAEGDWLRRLASVDARGAAGADRGVQFTSTAAWLRATCRMDPGAASRSVRTARALHRGPLHATAQALAQGDVSPRHAAVLADATHDLPPANVSEAEPVLVDAAQRLDPAILRRVATHLREVVDPERSEERERRRLERRGLWVDATFDGVVTVKGLLDPEAGEAVQAALAPLSRPAGPEDERSGAQRRADALAALARRALQAGDLPREGGLRPQVTVTVDLASIRTRRGGVGGTGGWGAVLPGETVRRLACDAVVTRAVVRRHGGRLTARPDHPGATYDGVLAEAARAAVGLLPPPLGAPVELLDLGRGARVVSPALRRALALRDGGCAATGCDRPPPWTDAHHLNHWADGGATSLGNLVLLCRVHHRAVHEQGWQLHHDPTSGRVTLAPPARRHPRSGHSPPVA